MVSLLNGIQQLQLAPCDLTFLRNILTRCVPMPCPSARPSELSCCDFIPSHRYRHCGIYSSEPHLPPQRRRTSAQCTGSEEPHLRLFMVATVLLRATSQKHTWRWGGPHAVPAHCKAVVASDVRFWSLASRAAHFRTTPRDLEALVTARRLRLFLVVLWVHEREAVVVKTEDAVWQNTQAQAHQHPSTSTTIDCRQGSHVLPLAFVWRNSPMMRHGTCEVVKGEGCPDKRGSHASGPYNTTSTRCNSY